MIHPLIYKESGSILTIKGDGLKRLKKKPKQILWIKDGLYGVIPIEVIKNALNLIETYDSKTRCLVFQWNETVEIPQSTGRSMEESNGRE